MDEIKIIRQQFKPEGVFGSLYDHNGIFRFMTGEHAYLDPVTGLYIPKVMTGTYIAKKGTGPFAHGMHALSDGVQFEAFEIQNVPPFQGQPVTGILFHPLNFPQKESHGCCGLGKQLGYQSDKSLMLMQSKEAFKEFMDSLKYTDQIRVTFE